MIRTLLGPRKGLMWGSWYGNNKRRISVKIGCNDWLETYQLRLQKVLQIQLANRPFLSYCRNIALKGDSWEETDAIGHNGAGQAHRSTSTWGPCLISTVSLQGNT
jgi:hypothetical protein